MQPIFMNVALAFVAGFCASACRNDDALTLVDAPKDPTPAEKTQFQATKINKQELSNTYSDPHPYQITANGATLVSAKSEGGHWITHNDYRSLQPGMTTLSGRFVDSRNGKTYPETIRSYQGFRSGVIVTYNPENGKYSVGNNYGVDTPLSSFPTAGHATYRGTAFDMNEEGTLTYHVDFAAKNGHGQIEGLSRYGTITLANAPIKAETNINKNKYMIHGNASGTKGSSFDYYVNFFGQQAEEIAGATHNTQFESVGFHGTRGAISE